MSKKESLDSSFIQNTLKKDRKKIQKPEIFPLKKNESPKNILKRFFLFFVFYRSKVILFR